MRALLDTNSLIKLASNEEFKKLVVEAHTRGKISIIVNDIVKNEATLQEKGKQTITDLISKFQYEESPRYFTIGKSKIGGDDMLAPDFDLWNPPADSKGAYLNSKSRRSPGKWITNKQNDARNYDHAIQLGADYYVTEEKRHQNKKFPGKPEIIGLSQLVAVIRGLS